MAFLLLSCYGQSLTVGIFQVRWQAAAFQLTDGRCTWQLHHPQWLAFLLLACYGQSLNVGIFQVWGAPVCSACFDASVLCLFSPCIMHSIPMYRPCSESQSAAAL